MKLFRTSIVLAVLAALVLTGCDNLLLAPPKAAQPPQAPGGVAGLAGIAEATITFAAVADAKSYNLYYAAAPTVTTATGTKVAGVSSPAKVTGLTNGMLYTFVVTAVNSSGESAPSAAVTVTPQVPPPGSPAGVSAASGDGQVTIDFDTVAGSTSYNLYYAAADTVTTGTGTKISGVVRPTTITGLNNGVRYTFIITAVNAGGESAPSSPVSATPQVPLPGAPTGVSSTGGNGSVTVEFQPVPGSTSYNLYYAAGSTVTTGTGTKLTGVTSPKTVTGLTNGTLYTFLVTAVNAGGESAPSAASSATPQVPLPAAPASLSVAAGDGEVTVSFAGASGATSYNLYYAAGSTVTTGTGTKVTGVTSPTIVTGLTNGTAYTFIVTATNAAGESSASAPSTGTPQPAASPTLPTRLLYTGGNLSKAYEANWTTGGNDTLVPGFDSAVYHAVFLGSDLYYLTFDGNYAVKKLNPTGTDPMVSGFDTLSYYTKLTTDGTDLYYTKDGDLYRMLPGTSDDVLITGFDRAPGTLYDGLFYKWDGTDWYYYAQTGPYTEWGVYRRVGTETNGTVANDVKLTGFDEAQIGPVSNDNTTEFYYRGWGPTSPVYQYNPSSPDTVLEGFDRKAGQIFYHGGKFYSLVSTKLYEKVTGTGDDSAMTTVDANQGAVFVGWNGTTTFTVAQSTSGKQLFLNNAGTDTEVLGFDDPSNMDFAVYDGTDYYYLVWDSTLMNRVIYKKVGTESNRSATNDLAVPGMDKNLGYGAYDFQKSGADIFYQNSGKVYLIVGTEATFTGSNDTQVAGFDRSVVHFSLINGVFYYSDSNQDIYKMEASGPDQLVFSGSLIDGDMTSMLLLP